MASSSSWSRATNRSEAQDRDANNRQLQNIIPRPPPVPDSYESYDDHVSGSSMRRRFKTKLTAPAPRKANLLLPEPANVRYVPPPPLQPNIGGVDVVDLEAGDNVLPPPQPNIGGVDVDLEEAAAANILQLQPVEQAAPLIPNPGQIVIVLPNYNLFVRIRILVAGLVTWVRLLVADLFARGWMLFDRLRVFFQYLYDRLRVLFEYLYPRITFFLEYFFARLRVFYEYLYARIKAFLCYLVKRNEEFRSEEEPDEMKPRLVQFQSNSTLINNMLWRFYKWVYIVNAWLMVLSVFAGVCYWKFGEGGSSNPKSLRFKDESMINVVVAVGSVSTVVYGCWVYHQWNELKLFKIRRFHIGFLALDIVCDIRSIKAVILTFYGFYDIANKYGIWTDFFLVGGTVFYSIWSLSILMLFQPEFYHAHGLINDFIVIFVGPMIIQFAHGSILNGVLYSIPIVFGRLSKFVCYIYRPHVTDDFYDPTTEN